MTYEHSNYADRFRQAEERTRSFGQVQLGLAFETLRHAGDRFALADLPEIGRYLDSQALAHFDLADIRRHCAEIHRSVFANHFHFRYPCVLTVGDVEVDGVPHYNTTYDQLHEEMQGLHRDSDRPYPCHVWLTFPDMHVVDVTFFIYRFPDKIPNHYRWSDYILCSDPRHLRSPNMTLRYLPMLVGEDCVRAMVDTEIHLAM